MSPECGYRQAVQACNQIVGLCGARELIAAQSVVRELHQLLLTFRGQGGAASPPTLRAPPRAVKPRQSGDADDPVASATRRPSMTTSSHCSEGTAASRPAKEWTLSSINPATRVQLIARLDSGTDDRRHQPEPRRRRFRQNSRRSPSLSGTPQPAGDRMASRSRSRPNTGTDVSNQGPTSCGVQRTAISQSR